MKANELMIGDWYAFRGHPYQCTASDIASIAECEEKGAPTDISEIPLTPEILEKNGFKKCDGNEWSFYKKGEGERGLYNILWSADELYLEIASYTPLIGEFNRMGVKYIHELQHALRLCRIDKEITI